MQQLEVSQSNFSSVKWEEDYFKYAKFSDISADGGNITSDFAYCEFTNIDWYWGIFNMVNFVGCRFMNCVFKGTSFLDCKFVECEFSDCRFIKDNLNGDCSFEESVAYSCEFQNTEGFAAQIR